MLQSHALFHPGVEVLEVVPARIAFAERFVEGWKEATGEEFLNWKIRLQLTKPATWVPLIWGVACGAAASGNYHALWNLFGDAPTTNSIGEVGLDTVKALSAMVLAGPFMCGFTQTINDW